MLAHGGPAGPSSPQLSLWREAGGDGTQRPTETETETIMIPEAGFYQPEVRPQNGAHPLTEDLLVMLKKVVPFLLNHPYSGPFKHPVNAKAEGIYPDYFKVCTGIPPYPCIASPLSPVFNSGVDYFPDISVLALVQCLASIAQHGIFQSFNTLQCLCSLQGCTSVQDKLG